jgi:hypothetical protein
MEGQPTAHEGLNRALCIDKKNYAMKVFIFSLSYKRVFLNFSLSLFQEDFFIDDQMQSSNIFQQNAGQKEYSYTSISDILVSEIYFVNFSLL